MAPRLTTSTTFVTASCGFRDAVCYPGIARVPPRKLERGRNGYLQPRSTLASHACIRRVHRSIDACVNILQSATRMRMCLEYRGSSHVPRVVTIEIFFSYNWPSCDAK
jgi:hypothetical protein